MKNIVLIENNIINQAINAIIKEYEIAIINVDKILDRGASYETVTYSSLKIKIYSILDVIRPIIIVNGLFFSKHEVREKNHEIFRYLNQALNDYSLYKSIPIITLTSFEFLSSSGGDAILETNTAYNSNFEYIKNIEEMFLKNPKCFLFRFSLIYSTFSSYGIITDMINQMYSDSQGIIAQNISTNIINTFDIAMILNKIIKLCVKKYFNFDDVEIAFGLYNVGSIDYFTIEEIFDEIAFCFEKFYERKMLKNLLTSKEKKIFILNCEKFESNFEGIFLPRIKLPLLHKDIIKIFQFQENIAKRKF